jgi:hypothetical protein
MENSVMTVKVRLELPVTVEAIAIVTVEVIVGAKVEVLQKLVVEAAPIVIVMAHQAARKDLMHLTAIDVCT